MRGNGRRSESPALSRVLVVNTVDLGGGAEDSARAIMDGFERLGTSTSMAVHVKRSQDARVFEMAGGPNGDGGLQPSRMRRRVGAARGHAARRVGLEDFDHPATWSLLDTAGRRPDLVVLLNLHGDYFDLRALPWLSRQVPVVMRLCDSWLFTGHCACPMGCERWQTGCGQCPDLRIPPAVTRDATKFNWHRKRRILAGARVAVTTPSQWLMDRARRSILSPAIASSEVIPVGVDLAVFAPGSRAGARRALGLPSEADVVSFVSNGGRANPFKDYATLRSAFVRLAAARRGGRRLDLLVVGREGPLEILSANTRIHHVGYQDTPARMADIYRASDLYVHAAAEETFCLAAAEALACGIPVIAAARGGIREVVRDGHTGVHVDPGRPDELAGAVAALLGDGPRRERMGRAAALDARERMDARRRSAELHAWCAEVAAGWWSANGVSVRRPDPFGADAQMAVREEGSAPSGPTGWQVRSARRGSAARRRTEHRPGTEERA